MIEPSADTQQPPRVDNCAPSATRVRPERVGTWSALKYREYRSLFTAGVLIFTAVQAQQIARGQLALDLSGSNKGLGGVYLGFGVPMLLLTPFGGVAADRLPKRSVLVVAQGTLMLSAAWIAIAGVTGHLEYWMLVGAAVLEGAGFSVFGPTRVAFTGELVPRALLGNAVALTQVSLNGTRVIAPALAGVLISIAWFGTSGLYLITTSVMSLSLIVTLRLPKRPPPERRSDRSVVGEFVDGVRYARRDPLLKMLVVTSFIMVMVGWPYLAFLPAVADDLFHTGPSGLGALSSVSAVAALGVTFWIAGRTRLNQAWRVQTASGFGLALGLLALAAAPTFGFGLAALFLIGGAASGYQSMNNTIVLTRSGVEYHGRVQSLMMLSFSGFGLAALPLGAVADATGLRSMFTIMGSICLVTMLAYSAAERRNRRRGCDFDLESTPS